MDHAFCGDNIRLRLRGVTDDDVQPGYVLTSPKHPVKAVTAFRADLSIIEAKNIICGGYSAVVHVHTLAEEVTITVSEVGGERGWAGWVGGLELIGRRCWRTMKRAQG